MVLEQSAGRASTIPSSDASNASDAALLDSARRFLRISLPCNLTSSSHFGPIEWIEVDEWYRGRVVLIGDAAHAGPPHMGEGGCMAMEDALVLADVLCTADRLETALETYVRRRRPRAGWVQEQSRAAAQAWVLPPAVRNAALRERGDQMFRDRYRPLIAAP
jgi:2-polyprenyl-6-methoxyphenol hydroxylase-like FAD-dependent oxidoreductase